MSIGPIPPAGLSPAASGKSPETWGKIAAAAKQFEALLLTQMLRAASTEGETDSMGGGDGSSSSLVELGQQQFAQALADNGGLGIAKIVIAGLESHANR